MKKLPITRETAMGKLTRAMIGLGLTYIDCLDILDYEEDCETAYWSYDPKTNTEKIVVGPSLAVLPIHLIQIVLRHEVLHRTTHNGFTERFSNKELANIVFDTCINQLIFISFPDDMKELASIIYSTNTQKTILCLPNPLANPKLIPKELYHLWKFVWLKNENGHYNILSSASLYYNLEEAFNSEHINPEDLHPSDLLSCGGGFREANSENINKKKTNRETSNQKSLEDLANACFNGLAGYGISKELEEHSVVPIHSNMKGVRDFLNRITATKIASKILSDLKMEDKYTEKFRPYPFIPTRKGMVYILSGISAMMSLYHNRISDINSSKLALGIYLDVSGSMESYFPYIPVMIDHLKSYPLKLFGFSDTLFTLNIEDIRKGIIQGGGGTDFNPILENLVDDRELHAALIITDGMGDISNENIDKTIHSQKKVYQIVFGKKSEGPLKKIVKSEYIFKIIE